MPWSARVLARYVPAGHWCEFTKPDEETRNKRLSRKHQPVPGWTCAEAPAQPGLAYRRAAGNLTQRPNPPDTLALGTQAPAPQLCSSANPDPRGQRPAGTGLPSGEGSWQGSARSPASHSLQTIGIYRPMRESRRRRLPWRTRHSPRGGHRPPPGPWPDDPTSSSHCQCLPRPGSLLPTFSFSCFLPWVWRGSPHAKWEKPSSNPPAHLPLWHER